MPHIQEWIVTLKGKEIDRVFFTEDCTSELIRNSLIEHDGYNNDISIKIKED